jgi:hypothetical protein
LSGVDADLYWTGEMGHHEVLAAVAAGHNVVLCALLARDDCARTDDRHTGNHSNTERGFLRAVLQPRLQQLLDEEAKDRWEVSVSEADRDPLEFVTQ